ncbi:MAG: YIP1 family protein [Pseudomonadota bacterium]
MNNLALAGTLASSPSAAFAELRERPRFWFPLLLVTLTSAALMYWYYSVVDVEWLKDAMYSQNPKFQAMPADQRAAAMGMMGRNTFLWGSTIGILFAIPLWLVLQSVYLLIAAKVTKLPLGFKHWFAFSSWTLLPALLTTVVAAILLLISDTKQMGPGILQPMSLNELLFHRPLGSAAQTYLDAVTIPAMLSWFLMIIGMRAWSQRSWTFSAIVILLPIVLLYGIWAFFAFR